MGIRFFVDQRDTVRYDFQVTGLDIDTGEMVTEDHWVELRAALSDREWADLETGIVNRMSQDGEIILNLSDLATKQMLTWITSWSLYNNGNPEAKVRPTSDMLGKLDRATAEQIRGIIQAHIESRQAAREAIKNPTGRQPALRVVENGSSGTSPTSSAQPKPRRRGAS